MISKRILHVLLIALIATGFGLPAQAAMVGTAQMQAGGGDFVLANTAQQREWIRQQLIKGGVEQNLAGKRVAAMTDAQVAMVHQRIDEMPAAGLSTGTTLLILGLVLVITELMGYTDFIPNWPAE